MAERKFPFTEKRWEIQNTKKFPIKRKFVLALGPAVQSFYFEVQWLYLEVLLFCFYSSCVLVRRRQLLSRQQLIVANKGVAFVVRNHRKAHHLGRQLLPSSRVFRKFLAQRIQRRQVTFAMLA